MSENRANVARLRWDDYILEAILVALCVLLAFTAPGFATMNNVLNVLRNTSMQGIIALGMTIVIISGEIDLSVGSAVAFAGSLTAVLTKKLAAVGVSLPAAIAIAGVTTLAMGFSLGVLAGLIRNKFKVPTFIITLASMTALSGFSMIITKGFPVSPFPEWFNFIGGGYLFGIPFPAIVFLLIFLLMLFLIRNTTFGRAVYAVGGNEEAARLSGISVFFTKTAALGLTSMLASLSGIMVAAQIMSGTPTTAKGWELDVISAVIIGGASLSGGTGTIGGTFVGMLFLGVLINGMTLLNINQFWQYVVRGGLILGAVLLNQIKTMSARR
jgi:ribose/xylose/arabinose/galactoside ABC-type transport system permease subunit